MNFCFDLLAPNQQNITARFARPEPLVIAADQNQLMQNREPTWKCNHPEKTDKMKLPPSFACFKKTPLKLPPKRTTHKTEFSRIQESAKPGFYFWVLNFSVLHNAGVKRRRVAVSA